MQQIRIIVGHISPLLQLHYLTCNCHSAILKVRLACKMSVNRGFPEVDHSANFARIVLVEYTIGSVVELNFC